MARKRVYDEQPKFREVTIDAATKMLTLEDPSAKWSVKDVAGVFVRLRPPPDTAPEVIEKWRASIAPHARAIRVLPTPRSTVVASSSNRVDEPMTKLDVRATVAKTIEESTNTDKQALHALCGSIMSEVGI